MTSKEQESLIELIYAMKSVAKQVEDSAEDLQRLRQEVAEIGKEIQRMRELMVTLADRNYTQLMVREDDDSKFKITGQGKWRLLLDPANVKAFLKWFAIILFSGGGVAGIVKVVMMFLKGE